MVAYTEKNNNNNNDDDGDERIHTLPAHIYYEVSKPQ